MATPAMNRWMKEYRALYTPREITRLLALRRRGRHRGDPLWTEMGADLVRKLRRMVQGIPL